MTKKDLVWRLQNRPTVDEIVKLIEAKVITPEEARNIAFNSVDENDKITKLEKEIELLKEAVKDASRGVVINNDYVHKLPTYTYSSGSGTRTVTPQQVFYGLFSS